MSSFVRRLFGMEKADAGAEMVRSGADYVGMAELMRFNRNLLEAQKHEKSGIDLYTRFLAEANDERGRVMYRKLIEEEERHLRMVEEEIEEHKRQGYWS